MALFLEASSNGVALCCIFQYVEGGPGIVAFLTKVNGYPGLGKIGMTILGLFGLILAVIGAGLLIT